MSQGEKSDEQLMAAVIGGDERALEALYDRYASQVRGFTMRILGERSAAEEIVQETFWRIWSRGKSFDMAQGSFKNWMFTIAHRLAIDTLRRQKARPQVELDESKFGHIYNSTAESEAVKEQIWQDERQRLLAEAVAQLPEEQAEIILMSYFEGLTRQEISDKTNTPLGTVHSRARLAMKKLRESLSKAGIKE
jgi:RNA polymerase sigma-70 factor (ECF subfamily)